MKGQIKYPLHYRNDKTTYMQLCKPLQHTRDSNSIMGGVVESLFINSSVHINIDVEDSIELQSSTTWSLNN